MRVTLPCLALVAIGLTHFAISLHSGLAAEHRSVVIDGVRFRHPVVARDSGEPVVARDLPIATILARRGHASPEAGAAATGCPLSVGLAARDGQPIVLLRPTPWGRLAELPGEGIVMLSAQEGARLAAPGRCVPAPAASRD